MRSLKTLYSSQVETDIYDAGENIGLELKYTQLIAFARGLIKIEHFGE